MTKTWKFVTTVFVCLVALVSCTTPSGGSSPTQGSNQPATNLAQTVGNAQAAVPSTANGGQGYNELRFASEGDATVRLELLKLAAENHWTPEQITAAFASASSAPQTVTITGNISSNGGNSSAIGSGTGGGLGQTGSGTVTKP